MSQARANLIGAPATTREDAVVAPLEYEGLVTRAIALALDAAIINLVAIVVGVGVGLIVSVLSLGDEADSELVAVGSVCFAIWSVAYFVVFWSTTGQTPGNRVMRIRVCRASGGGVLSPRRSLLRMAALVLAALPLFAGFLTVLFDNRRRGLHDMLAGTVVVGSAADDAVSVS